MNPHYIKVFERKGEDEKSMHPDSLFEESYGPPIDREHALSAESLWNLSDDSMMLFTGIDSSNQTSEASEFTTFSELGYNDNPSSIFSQSLGIFGSNGEITAVPSEQNQDQEVNTADDLRSVSAEQLPFNNMLEHYNNPLLGGEVEGGLGWCLDLLKNSRDTSNDDIENTPSANPRQIIAGRGNNEDLPESNSIPNEFNLRQNFESLQQNLTPFGYKSPNGATQTLHNHDNWGVMDPSDEAKINDTHMPWEWHIFDTKRAEETSYSTLGAGPSIESSVGHSKSLKTHSEPHEKDHNPEIGVDDVTGKKERRKPKPIAKRFQPIGTVTVVPSYVQCLNIVLDYHGYTGIITRIVLNNAITNVAYQQHDSAYKSSLMRKPLTEYYAIPEHEELVGTLPAATGPANTISLISGVLQRKIHVRDISSILNSVNLIAYVKSGRFSIHNPYEPQYYRYELDAKGKAVNESKCGMCAFCPTVKFLPFKNSSYLSHMTLEHGIFASNFVVPEGLYYGRYRMMRSTDPSKTRTVKALQCPACFQVIEVACWKNKTNPLLSYFRHFKKLHLNLNKTFTSSSIDPVTLKHRGGNISQSETLNLADRQ